MARTLSNMLPLGTKAPDFHLLDTVSNQFKTLQALKGTKGTLIMFICNHCPFVKHVNAQLAQLAKDYASKGINCIAISSNDIDAYPQDAPIYMKQNALAEGFCFPYLYDATQEVARLYEAACTPDFYVFNADLHLVYRGQLDASRPGNGIPVTGKDLRNALDNMLNNKAISALQNPSIGCGIKWKTATT
jgi:thiol-disulfide isomerase/thioredoxin